MTENWIIHTGECVEVMRTLPTKADIASFRFKAPQDPTGQILVTVQTHADPRPDLGQGAPLWLDLLTRAAVHDADQVMGLYGILRGLRSLGAGLALRPTGGARLFAGQIPEAQYLAYRERFLSRHAAALTDLLAQVRV